MSVETGKEIVEVLPKPKPSVVVAGPPVTKIMDLGGAPKPAAVAVKPKIAPAPPVTSHGSLVSRVASILDQTAGAPPASFLAANQEEDTKDYFHFMLYGNPGAWKTTTAALFQAGPGAKFPFSAAEGARAAENTRIIVTRRKEQMIPLKGIFPKSHYRVTPDAESLEYALLFPEKIWPEWADLEERTLLIDDVTEGVLTFVDGYRFYTDEKTGESKEIKDPRQAYKKAGDKMHDLFKVNLGKKQHVGLIAVEKGYEVDGTIDYRIEPDVPNKVAKLFETELEYVFYLEEGDQGKMLTRPRVITRTGSTVNPKTKLPDVWREITYAKNKIPLLLTGKGVLQDKEDKNLAAVWAKIQAALRGEAPLTAGVLAGGIKAPIKR